MSQIAQTKDQAAAHNLASEIYEVTERLLDKASQRRDHESFSATLLMRARIAMRVERDPARIIPDAGIALLISAGNPITPTSMNQRYESAAMLALSYYTLADPVNATTAAVEGLLHGNPSPDDSGLNTAVLCKYLLSGRNQHDNPYFASLLNVTEQVLPELVVEPALLDALQSLIWQRLGVDALDYQTANASWLKIRRIDPEIARHIELPAGQLLADCAVAEGLDHVALALVDRLAVGRPRAQWLETPLFEIAASCYLRAGDHKKALVAALDGYLLCLIASHLTTSTTGRVKISALGRPCRNLAMRIACDLEDWTTLLEILVHEPIQATLGAHDRVEIGDWILDQFPPDRSLKHGTHTILSIVAGDWDTPLENQVVYTRSSSSHFESRLKTAVAQNAEPPKLACLTGALNRCRTTENLAWFTSVTHSTLYWATVDLLTNSIEGGQIDLDGTRAGQALSAFRLIHIDEDNPNSELEPAFLDPVRWLAEPNSKQERLLMTAAGELLPPAIRQRQPGRVDTPQQILASLAPDLTYVPWAVVRIGESGQRRLIEDVEIELMGPISQLTSRRLPNPTGYEISLSCSNPDGTLLPTTPVLGHTTLDGSRTPVNVDTFLEHLSAAANQDMHSVLFVRGHLGSEGSTWWAPDRGLLFANQEVVSGRFLSTIALSHSQLLKSPDRAVLAACMSSIADATEGTSFGFCSALKKLGTAEVIGSLFPVPDTKWSCDFDQRLAHLATEPASMAKSLRSVQLVALDEWQAGDSTHHGYEYEDGPTPLVWAAYVSVR